jgi:hypothetical protein
MLFYARMLIIFVGRRIIARGIPGSQAEQHSEITGPFSLKDSSVSGVSRKRREFLSLFDISITIA